MWRRGRLNAMDCQIPPAAISFQEREELERLALPLKYELIVTSMGGYCPVQAEGLLNKWPFYFRARWQGWSFELKPRTFTTSFNETTTLRHPFSGCHGSWGEDEYSAGSMPFETAERLMHACALAFALYEDVFGEYDVDSELRRRKHGKEDARTAPGGDQTSPGA